MAKFLIWAVIILAVLMVIRILNFKKSLERTQQSKPAPTGNSEDMVRCAHCNIYLPRSEAYMSRGQTWCCAQHAQLGLKKQN